MHTYIIMMTAMALLAVVVYIALFHFKAGYGYLSTANWGPKINNRAAWVIMEAPAFCFLLFYSVRFGLSGIDTGNDKTVLYTMAGLFLIHYFQRAFIFPLLMRGNGKMPIAIMSMGMIFNTLNSYFIGAWLYRFAPSGMYTTHIPHGNAYKHGFRLGHQASAQARGYETLYPAQASVQIRDIGQLFRGSDGMDRICHSHLVSGRTAVCHMDIRKSRPESQSPDRKIRRGIRG